MDLNTKIIFESGFNISISSQDLSDVKLNCFNYNLILILIIMEIMPVFNWQAFI